MENTIDERLLRLQKYKDEIIGGAMDNRAVLAQLSLKELLSLFGEVGQDANDQPFIYYSDKELKKSWGELKESEVVIEDEEPELEEDGPFEEAG